MDFRRVHVLFPYRWAKRSADQRDKKATGFVALPLFECDPAYPTGKGVDDVESIATQGEG